MAKFLTTRGVSSEIENIIRNAKNELVLISPYISLPDTLLKRLKEAEKQSVKITLVYGKKEMSSSERSRLQELKKLEIYFLVTLHAKCYYNEEHMVITSMNLLDFSEKNNQEMGILIGKEQDEEVFNEAVKEACSIIKWASKIKPSENIPSKAGKEAKVIPDSAIRTRVGYCLRCRVPIPWELEHPYCYDCFSEWNFFGNLDYEERFCHTCGKAYPTTIEKPLCYSCYDRLQK